MLACYLEIRNREMGDTGSLLISRTRLVSIEKYLGNEK